MNKSIKKILAVIFIISLVLSLAACDKTANPDTTPQNTLGTEATGSEGPNSPVNTDVPPTAEQSVEPGQTPNPIYTPVPGQTVEPGTTSNGVTPNPSENTTQTQTQAPSSTNAPGVTSTASPEGTTSAGPTASHPNNSENTVELSHIGSTFADKRIFGDFVTDNAQFTLKSYVEGGTLMGVLSYTSHVDINGVDFFHTITVVSPLDYDNQSMQMVTELGAAGVAHSIQLQLHGESSKVEDVKRQYKQQLTDAGFTSEQADSILNGNQYAITSGMPKAILAMIEPVAYSRMNAYINGQRIFFTGLVADKNFPTSNNITVEYDYINEKTNQITFLNQAGNRKTVDTYGNDGTELGYLKLREVYVLSGGQWVLESSTEYDKNGNPINPQPTHPPQSTATPQPTPKPTTDNTEREYYDTGELKSETVYSNKNKTNWVKTEYNKNGTVLAEYTYSSSKLTLQKLYQYNSDGTYIEQTSYQYDKSGKVTGTAVIDIQYYKDGSRKEANRNGQLECYYDKNNNLVKRITDDPHNSYSTEETWEGDVHTEIYKNANGKAYSKIVTTSNSYDKPLLIANYRINPSTGAETLQSTWTYTYRNDGISVLTATYKNAQGQTERYEQYTYNTNGTKATMTATDGKSTVLEKYIYDGNGSINQYYGVTRNANGDITGATQIEYLIKGVLQSTKLREKVYDVNGVLLNHTEYNEQEKKTHYIEYYANGNMKIQHCYDPDTGKEYRCIEYDQNGDITNTTDYD